MLLAGMTCMTGKTRKACTGAGLQSKTDKYQFVC